MRSCHDELWTNNCAATYYAPSFSIIIFVDYSHSDLPWVGMPLCLYTPSDSANIGTRLPRVDFNLYFDRLVIWIFIGVNRVP